MTAVLLLLLSRDSQRPAAPGCPFSHCGWKWLLGLPLDLPQPLKAASACGQHSLPGSESRSLVPSYSNSVGNTSLGMGAGLL